MIKIAPSTNPEKEENLVNYVKELEQAGADFLHCDVMDGKFVKASCLGVEKLMEVSQNSTIALDVHLMVEDPINKIAEYSCVKPTILTVHYESFKNKANILYAIEQIHKMQIMAGLSIKPATKIDDIKPFLPYLDLVLIMSVEPGKSGQAFIEETHQKVNDLKNYLIDHNLDCKIEVDGGINIDNIVRLYQNGMDIAVMGSAIYKAQNRAEFINKIKANANKNKK